MCGSKMRTATDWCSARRCLERHQDVRGPGKFFYKSTTGQSRLTILLFYPPKQWLFKGEEARRYIHVVKVTRQMHTKTFFFGRVQMRPDNMDNHVQVLYHRTKRESLVRRIKPRRRKERRRLAGYDGSLFLVR